MKRSTAWWIVGLLMLFAGMLLWLMHGSAAVPATPTGIALVLATSLGYAVGVALIPLILAIITRFRHPWVILGTYGLCVLGVLIVLHDRQRPNITNNMATRSVEMTGSQPSYADASDQVSTVSSSPTNEQPQSASATEATQADTPYNRAKFCEQLDSNLVLLSGDQPIAMGDTNMTDVQRQQELVKERAQKAQYCRS